MRDSQPVLYDSSGNPLLPLSVAGAAGGNALNRIPAVAAMSFDGSNIAHLPFGPGALSDADGGVNSLATGVQLFNGATFDRSRNSEYRLLLASAARTSTTLTATQTNYNHRGIQLVLNVTVNPGGAQTLQVNVYSVPTVVGAFGILQTAALANSGNPWTQHITMVPGCPDAPFGGTGATAKQIALPRFFAVQVVHSGAGSWTYSLEAFLIL